MSGYTTCWLDSVMGEAPDAVLIFRERFLAENPDATEYDYMDALGYWLRDEYYPQYFAAQQPVEPVVVADTTLTKEMAEKSFRGHLTEVFNLSSSVVEKAQSVSEQDAQSGAWHVTTSIDASVMRQIRQLKGIAIEMVSPNCFIYSPSIPSTTSKPSSSTIFTTTTSPVSRPS